MPNTHDSYTPGPWEIATGQPHIVRAPFAGYHIADTFAHRTSRANARLIAAAPDLLEALQDLLDQVRGTGNVFDDSHAIAAVHSALGTT